LKTYNIEPTYFDDNNDLIIEKGTTGFITDVLAGNTALTSSDTDYASVKSIEERRLRLTENDFILATSYTFTKTTKTDLLDNTFTSSKQKIESSLLTLISNTTNQVENKNGTETFNLEYSEYIKTEFDYIKHWDLKEKVLLLSGFFGIATFWQL
jgi:hypothetical protein